MFTNSTILTSLTSNNSSTIAQPKPSPVLPCPAYCLLKGRHVELIGGLTLLIPQLSIVPQHFPAAPYHWAVHSTPLREITLMKREKLNPSQINNRLINSFFNYVLALNRVVCVA